MQEGGLAGSGGDVLGGRNARSEISLAFSACLLPGGVSALLCSRLGAWMPTGARVYFNQFATGRLLCVTLPDQFSDGRGARGETGDAVAESVDRGDHGPDPRGESDAPPGKDGPAIEAGRVHGGKIADAEQTGGFPSKSAGGRGPATERPSSAAARRLFATHESTGDLLFYDGHPDATVRALSLPSGAGGLRLRTQCKLRPPPSPSSSPVSFAARSNLAVFVGGGACSVYDLCTGRLVGTAAAPGCTAGAGRRPDRSLWMSETRGHLVGVLTATRVLRVRLPTAEACLAATLSPSSRRGKQEARPEFSLVGGEGGQLGLRLSLPERSFDCCSCFSDLLPRGKGLFSLD